MDSFPAFFPLQGRTVVVVGAGEAAEAKARLFDGSPAHLVRLDGEAALDATAYGAACLVFIAASDPDFLKGAVRAAHAAGAPVNVVDHPDLCDFVTPAVIDRGEVVAAIGTGGASPMLASLLRQDIEARVPEGAGRVAALFRLAQDQIRAAIPDLARRRAFLRIALTGPIAEAATKGDDAHARMLLNQALAEHARADRAMGRMLWLRGDGPADLVTLRAARALGQADTLVIGTGASSDILELARRDAHRLSAPDLTIEALAALAREGQLIVRLFVGPTPDAAINALEALGVTCEMLAVADA